MSKIEYFNMDCMIGLARYPDKYFDLAIVDPPYGANDAIGRGNGKSHNAKRKDYQLFDNQKPPTDYFNELLRVSKNQIIWGGNYFMGSICKDSQCWIVWNKHTNGNFADCELAYTSFDTATKMFDFVWNGMMQNDMKKKRFVNTPHRNPSPCTNGYSKTTPSKATRYLIRTLVLHHLLLPVMTWDLTR